jgi:hypothetical protein
MPAPYSYDLRTKAIEAVQRGERKSAVCRMLQISRNTLALICHSKQRKIQNQGELGI